MTDSDENRQQTAKALAERRVYLAPEYKSLAAFSRATGINYRTLQRIEAGREHRFSEGTLLALDRAYQYPPGTIRHMLDGASPPTDAPPGPILVPRGERPPIEDAEPELRLHEKPPLRDGEALEAWVRDDGRWHYHYIAEDELDLRTSFDAGVTLVDVVRRLRGMAAIARSDM